MEKLYLAGGFANYVNVENAIRIGFIANINKDRVMKVARKIIEKYQITDGAHSWPTQINLIKSRGKKKYIFNAPPQEKSPSRGKCPFFLFKKKKKQIRKKISGEGHPIKKQRKKK